MDTTCHEVASWFLVFGSLAANIVGLVLPDWITVSGVKLGLFRSCGLLDNTGCTPHPNPAWWIRACAGMISVSTAINIACAVCCTAFVCTSEKVKVNTARAAMYASLLTGLLTAATTNLWLGMWIRNGMGIRSFGFCFYLNWITPLLSFIAVCLCSRIKQVAFETLLALTRPIGLQRSPVTALPLAEQPYTMQNYHQEPSPDYPPLYTQIYPQDARQTPQVRDSCPFCKRQI